ncbi:MAG TPA: pseudaminic acid synthase [Planctomycetes bacterium]|nr:pseudaminic acid synthase [Planctomycetota bacterium]
MVKLIAETGASHRQSYARSMALIHASYKAGADAVKFSAFRPYEMTLDKDESPFVIESGPWEGLTLYSLYQQSALCYDWIPDLKRATESCGMEFILSVYHPDTAALLNDWGIRTVKIASFESAYTELLEAVADSRATEVILSTGGACEEDVERAVKIFSRKKLTLLHCVSAYPSDDADMNLCMIAAMRERFGLPVGLSDHSTGLTAPVSAVAMAATVIEKHIKLDDEGLDAAFAVFPDIFAAMVAACRQAVAMIGTPCYTSKKSYHRDMIEGQMLRKVW